MDGNGVGSRAFVAHGGGWGEEVGSTAQVSYGIERGGGRTSGMGRMTKTSGEWLN